MRAWVLMSNPLWKCRERGSMNVPVMARPPTSSGHRNRSSACPGTARSVSAAARKPIQILIWGRLATACPQ